MSAAAAAGAALARRYREIARLRMAGLPICNPALAVDDVGFRAFGDEALGVLVTPWCMNLVLLPPAGAPTRRAGAIREVAFPAGTIALTVTEPDGLGRVDAASLFSPMHEFADPEAARLAALAALGAVLQVPPPRRAGRRGLLFGPGAA